MGYSLFKVAFQGDSVGNRLKEVQEGVNDLAKFGKMVDLASFMPFEYVTFFFFFFSFRRGTFGLGNFTVRLQKE